ncbi:aminotransferase class V-fold PLP-dependent enzyme [Puia dinghuensis]|uniref:Selenocysteine lyase n=1 Tax=Puia dinghuensis TaxID=1792502 RepID=A0A8J2UI40_9BACT|nr:aminotransferase class V-fold PLP-dependent enzyme [Puia dinghuensis]GGB20706.1 selenocysteine lyase [Puia dinghuensis]
MISLASTPPQKQNSSLETWFAPFRRNIIGQDQHFDTPFGRKKMVYADWTASGRAYRPIEQRLLEEILPFFGNTHTETTITGRRMSAAYEGAKTVIKEHVHASAVDILLFCGSGMTAAVNKLQRMLGLRLSEKTSDYLQFLPREEASRPLILVTHMEHHSNHISWLETLATVEMIRPDGNGNVDLRHLRQLLEQHRHRKIKIAAVTACSNVTGIETPYHAIATLMHEYDGLCFVDFASSAPYVHIDMHPEEPSARLDAIYFSCHKFLGGPGTPGVLIVNKGLCNNRVPDHPGGGTILYSNPWKEHEYTPDIQQREDGGTPPILQGIKAAMCIQLKEEMGIDNIRRRETEMLKILFDRFEAIPGIHILAENNRERLGIISFIVDGAHHDHIVQLLNDRFGIQARGGCSCAGPYGHLLLNIDKPRSYKIWHRLRAGDINSKPGWIRLSFHPTMTDADIHYIMDAVESTVAS